MGDFWSMTDREKADIERAIKALNEWKCRIAKKGYDGGSEERIKELGKVLEYLQAILDRANEG